MADTHHTTVREGVVALAALAEALYLDEATVKPLGGLVARRTFTAWCARTEPGMAVVAYGGALHALATQLVMYADYLNEMVVDELATDRGCTCADEVALLRDLCGTHDN